MEDMHIELINEDGTKYNPPKNPLLEKWNKNVKRNGEPCSDVLGHYDDGRPIMNYSCVLCNEKGCYHSDSFEVPDEDKEIYEQYQKDLDNYHKIHNSEFYLKLRGNINSLLEIK